jgi:hypothetical protein
MSDKSTFSSITLELFIADVDRWLLDRLDKVPSDRGGKPQDAYFDRGQIAAFREMRRLITNTKNSEPCL